jgi:6-phosphofructokinase
MKNKGLISYDNPGEIVPLLVRDIQGVICDIDMSDESFDIASMPRNQELAVQFAKAVWETELDAHGNVTKLAGIRNFIIKALNILGGIERVNENLLNYEARGVSPDEYDRTMARKIGEKMAELINQGVKGGKAVIYFEDVDAMTEEPEVVDLVGVSDENNLNNEDMYPEELLIENGVFWDKAKELIDNQADEDLFLFEIESGKVILRSCIGGKRELINRDYERLSEEDIKRGVKEGRFYWVRESELVGGIQREKSGLIVTEGGDSAGIGDTISSLVFNLDDGYTAFGVRKAGKGLEVTPAHFNDSLVWYDDLVAEDLQGQSSTPTGASRTNPLVTAEENALVNIGGRRFFCATGGNGAMRMLVDIARRIPDILALGTLKSIDGDACINGRPVQMLGFNTAVKTYREAIYAAAQNARTHGEMHVIEVFGRDAGRLAFEAARWYPKDFNKLSTEERRKIIECRDRIVILVPERPVSLMEIAKKAKEIKDKKGNCVVVVAEGFRPPELKEEVERLSQDNNLKIRWLKSNQSDEQFAESFRLMKDKGLIEYQSANDVIPLCVGEIRDLIEVSGDTDPRSALKAILFDKELAAQFAKMVWEIETDKYGTVTKMSGIRKFIIQALIRLGGAKKVNEMLKTYEARGASPSEYDSVMGRKIGKKWAELINEGTTGVKAVVYFEGMDAMTEDPFVVDIETVSAENNLNQTYYSDELLQENGVFWVKENKPQEGLAHGSHLVKRVDGSLAENEIYSARVNENGVLIGGNKPRDKKDEIEGYMTALQQTLERLAHIYGPGIFTKIENVRIVENLNSENLYPQGRSPLASYKDGVLKIDVLSFKHGPWILFEELEHEFIESIAGLVPGSNEIISDIIATYRNAMRFLKPNEGVNDTALKYDVAVYQEGILSVVRAPGNPIDPDGEYLNLLTYLNNLQKLNEVTENEVILAVVRYVMRTKLYEKAREQLNLPDEVAKKIREFHLKVGDAMSVFGEIAKAKQPVDLTDRIKGTNNITVTVTKTFTGLRVNGLDSISAKLAEIVGALVKQITSTDKLSGALTKMDTAKYILGDKERLEELKKAMGERDYEAIAANLKRNNFELVTELPESVDLGHVIRLVDPGDLEKMPNIDRMYYLPMPYTRSALYMAANIIQAEGDLNKIPLVKELIEDLYKGLDEADIIALITRPWTILPKIKPVIEEINNIRKAIVEIEKAA